MSAARRDLPAGRLLPGNRLHLQEGPIDLMIGADGPAAEVEAAYRQAAAAFEGLLAALVAELPLLRLPVPVFQNPLRPRSAAPGRHPRSALARHRRESGDPEIGADGADLRASARHRLSLDPRFRGDDDRKNGDDEARRASTSVATETAAAYLARFRHPVARAMAAACLPHAALWVTPMAAVAGAVADFVLAAALEGRGLTKAWVNDGGDVAFHLAPGAALELGLVGDLGDLGPSGFARIPSDSRVRGVATSGRQGRSLSRGIADAVTVLAPTAAAADAAATLIANAVDLEEAHPAVQRRPASDLIPDSDLGALPVVAAVGPLAPHEIERALASGAALAQDLRRDGLIGAALLTLRGRRRAVPHQRQLERKSAWS